MLRIAIISDVHAFAQLPDASLGAEGDPSWVRAAPADADSRHGPFVRLEKLIGDEGLSVDVLVCPGDMGDKADRHGITHTWGWLESIRRRLDAELLVATTGNHDVDSYNKEERDDPTNAIRALQPMYPLDDRDLRDEYWQRNFTVVSRGNWSIGLLNTCDGHTDKSMAERGRISEATLDYVRQRIDGIDSDNRVLVCHHHPYRHDVLDRADNSEADGGPELLRLLEDNGHWLVIHGHRHYPTIAYAGGSAQAPAIIAAGSFSAILYPELTTRIRNQFSIVEVEGVAPISGTAGVTGRVRSWEFNVARGWVRPQSLEGIPDGAGFGCRYDASEVAVELENAVKSFATSDFLTLEQVLTVAPHLAYLIPRDREYALRDLAASGTISVAPNAVFAAHPREVFLKLVEPANGANIGSA